jgi:2-methylisocitrate lyase-like PEP mutase family enzyme
MTSTADKARALDALHIPGEPLIVTNVWDAITAKVVAAAPGVKAIATASHAISFARGVADGEGMTVDQALESAAVIARAVELPVSVDFERGYAIEPEGVHANVTRLIEAGAAGLNFEDSTGDAASPLFPVELQVERIRAVRAAADAAGVPLVLNARSDGLVRGADWAEARDRANAYLEAGANVVFVLGLSDEEKVARAIAEIDGRISTIGGAKAVPLPRLAELGVSRVSFGPFAMGLTLAHLHTAAAQLTALGAYPPELGFEY